MRRRDGWIKQNIIEAERESSQCYTRGGRLNRKLEVRGGNWGLNEEYESFVGNSNSGVLVSLS